MEGKQAVGARIRQCAAALEIDGPQALLNLLIPELRKLDPRQSATRQTVSNWWHGKVYPSLDTLPALAAVLQCDQEFILFGKRRGDQLKMERQYLSRVNDLEALALTYLREMNQSAQKSALKVLRTLAEDQPAQDATVHQLRRRTDKPSKQ